MQTIEPDSRKPCEYVFILQHEEIKINKDEQNMEANKMHTFMFMCLWWDHAGGMGCGRVRKKQCLVVWCVASRHWQTHQSDQQRVTLSLLSSHNIFTHTHTAHMHAPPGTASQAAATTTQNKKKHIHEQLQQHWKGSMAKVFLINSSLLTYSFDSILHMFSVRAYFHILRHKINIGIY